MTDRVGCVPRTAPSPPTEEESNRREPALSAAERDAKGRKGKPLKMKDLAFFSVNSVPLW